ncbi:alpha/beta hydrolase [Rathayibacter tanaceti]|nr:alpha/beta hydrolase [Rathayibacter tanaceti]QHC56694.1 hypothetical protein GSU10_14385 [Rathayibacter tanaceti]
METIRFDDETARRFAQTLMTAADVLRGQSVVRGAAAEQAMQDFEGPSAQVFWLAHLTQVSNRSRLDSVLFTLSEVVLVAIAAAGAERERLAQVAAWEARQEERRLDPMGVAGSDLSDIFRRPPSEDRILPPTIAASYWPQEPERTTAGVGVAPGGTSADPERLDVFVSDARQADEALRVELDSVSKAFAAFSDLCSWVPLESTTVFAGFQQLQELSRSLVDWVDQVSRAFEAAGGGRLSSATLEMAVTAGTSRTDRSALDLLSTVPADQLAVLLVITPELGAQLKRIPPTDAHTWWTQLAPADGGAGFSARQEALIGALPGVVGNLEGVPYGARAQANKKALTERITALSEELAQESADGDPARLRTIETDFQALENIRNSLDTRAGQDPRFLVSLTEDHPPLAAVSIGDLDTATSVTYAVPGMGQTTETADSWVKASQNVRSVLPDGSAVIAWIGYETPPPAVENVDASVLDIDDAVAGAAALAASLHGLSAVRGDSIPKPGAVGHSYGTTVVAITAARSDVELGTFVSLGSAGLPDSVDAVSDLHVEDMYAGQARDKLPFETESGDEAAWIGRRFSRDHHVNPADPGFGAHVFGVETGGDEGRIVTNHDATKSDDGPLAGYLDQGTESLANVGRAFRGEVDALTEDAPLGPTDFQKFMKGMIAGETGILP